MRIRFSLLVCALFVFFNNPMAQSFSLKKEITKIIITKKATIGVGVYNFDSGKTLIINGNHHYTMQSVYKFHLALMVLHQVDRGKLSLEQKIHLTKNDLNPNTWSPLAKKYPGGNIDVPLKDILSYTVSESDNNGCDKLFKLVGGPQKVDEYIHSLGIKSLSIKATEEEMHNDWNVQYTNWTTPLAAIQLLHKFYKGKILSEKSFDFLWKIMNETVTGAGRIKGMLPKETIVAHKTGGSGINDKGITAATNDIGIVSLPDGKHYAIAVFISDSKENSDVNEKTIAEISKITWDYFQRFTR
jgi:beta-lactamase class A